MTFKPVWQDEYQVHSYQVNMLNQLRCNVLCQFMQESAWHHAEHLQLGYTDLMRKQLIWVLSRQRIRIHRLPRWQETLTVETWPTDRDTLFCYRDFRISDADHQILALASTSWAAIDMQTHRLRPTADYFIQNFRASQERAFEDRELQKIAVPENVDEQQCFFVRFRDLDPNGHVNNVAYLEWILDGFSLKHRQAMQLQEIEINYLAEAFYGDQITVQQSGKSDHFMHSLQRQNEHSICRATTSWKSAATRTE